MDVLDLWRGKLSPRKALNLIDHLPRTSHFMAAVADDDELTAHADAPRRTTPPLTEWSAEIERLTLIADRLGEVVVAIGNTVAKRPRKPPRPLPRPITAYDRAQQARRRATHDHIKRLVAPAPGRRTMADPPPGGEVSMMHSTTRRPQRPGR